MAVNDTDQNDVGEQDLDEVRRIADAIADQYNEDVILYNGPIAESDDGLFIGMCRENARNSNVLLALVTDGGSPDAAYRIAVALQDRYDRFRLFVPGICKSAGTLIAVGAHDLVIGDEGQLGPLDVQMGYGGSGLNVSDSLMALNDKALDAFEGFYERLIDDYQDLQFHTAMSVATELTVQLYTPVFAQVDPMYVGETHRAMLVAHYYGMRLLSVGQNIDEEGLHQLVWDYVSHEFVINRAEASTLFSAVYPPRDLEVKLASELGDLAQVEIADEDNVSFDFLSGSSQ